MAQCYADYYEDLDKILTLIEYGKPKEREIALGSLVVHHNTKSIELRNKYYKLAWRVFISDEHITVKEHALGTACHFATNKQLIEIAEYVRHKDFERRDLLYASRVLGYIVNRYKEGKLDFI